MDPLIKEIRDNLEQAWQAERDNRRDAAVDLAFLAGDQWPDAVRRDREAANRPMLTINRLPQFVRQVTNDIRQSDLAIKVSPVDDKSDPEMAKVYNGLLKQIQYQSSAPHVYASAAEHQCACGIGWWRIITDYVDDSAWDQEIKIKPIRNPLSVYWDPASTEIDRSDASWMAVIEGWPIEHFKRKYPDKAVVDVEVTGDDAESRLFWRTKEEIRIAEYWRKVPYQKTLALIEGQDGPETIDITEMGEAAAGLLPIIKTRKQQAWKVESYICSGAEVLEGPFPWAGKFIPLVPVIGGEVPLEKQTIRYGVIRHARDSQMLYNYSRSAAAESIALAPKSPWLVTAKMISAVKRLWDTANSKNHPYLVYDPDEHAPHGPKREHAPEIPAAYVQEAQIAAEDMKATTGIYDASLGQRSNETSGRAILARQREGDVANYHFSDNLKRALEHCGRILLDLIPKVYDNERVVRVLGEDDGEDVVPINKVLMGVDGEPVVFNDLSSARFDIRVSIGPSYSTRRVEASDQIMAFLQAIPNAAPLVGDLVAKMQDWPLADEIAKRLKNMLPPQALIDPENPQDAPPPDPMAQHVEELKIRGASAEVRKTEAEAAKVEAEAEALQLQNAGLVDPSQIAGPGVFDQGISPSFDLLNGQGNEGPIPPDTAPEMMGDMQPLPPEAMPPGAEIVPGVPPATGPMG